MRQLRSDGHGHLLGALALLGLLAGCGGVRVTAENALPRPLIEELPLKAGVYYSAEFRAYTAHEKRWSTQWEIVLGAAHVAAIDRLTKSMFASVAPVADLARPPAGLDLILEPRFEEYSFLTPRDSGGEIFAVTIKYRINIYDGEGRLVDSLVLTGFGNEVAGSLSSGKPLAAATRKAMRDAGAKFASEFPDQPVVRKLARHEHVEPIAQGVSAAGDGSVAEVQPTAARPALAAPPAAAPAAAPAASTGPASTPQPASGAPAPVAPASPPSVAPAAPSTEAGPPPPPAATTEPKTR